MNLIEKYRQHLVKHDRSEKTIHGYTTDLVQFERWLNKHPLSKITEVDVREYRDHMLKQGNSPNTINRRIASRTTSLVEPYPPDSTLRRANSWNGAPSAMEVFLVMGR